MLTTSRERPRREIFNCMKEVYIYFDAKKSRDEFTIIFDNEEIAYEFAIILIRTIKEVDEKGHYCNSEKVSVFTDEKKQLGKIKFGEKEFSYKFSENTNPTDFHTAFVQAIWGDTAD